MQTILTKFIPATDHKPARVKAIQQNEGQSQSVTVSWDELWNAAPQSCRDSVKECSERIKPHALAARRLMAKLRWEGEMICGDTESGTVWVFSDSTDRITNAGKVASHGTPPSTPAHIESKRSRQITGLNADGSTAHD